jgi:predicted DCC family thiol-disulfide oxidoreductase YuxK
MIPVTQADIWFIYDGDCPICTHAALAFKIRQHHGQLLTLNARDNLCHPLIQQINEQQIDLDEGMVIYAHGKFYHGAAALRLMASYGRIQNPFMFILKSLYGSKTLTRLTYPWLRGLRNYLLRHKKVPQIDNLRRCERPIFQDIFGETWDALPPVLKKHYANRPYTEDKIVVQGVLDVYCKAPLIWLAVIMRWLKQIPVCNENAVPTTVIFQSDPNTPAFQFRRTFYFQQEPPYQFASRMICLKGNNLVEEMRYGLGWKLQYRWDGEKIILSHQGYVVRCLGHWIPLPVTWILGAGYAEEYALDAERFSMFTHITHPWWGKVYEYKGVFQLS